MFMGLAAVGFIWPLRYMESLTEGLQGSPNIWLFILLAPAAGGLITGILITLLRTQKQLDRV